ncbi:interleukin-17 receptor C [Carlito syrichta]|uniref:Interleukin-17 receptor C n=1 Tax=Carlito syrichta TaxID=1868482 RepID=A0A3Q0E7K5_CARSF|nr:interleukin-17 receptor C [Carlito syrichta]
MPVPWFLLSLALGRSPMVLSLERAVGPQDATQCSPGLSCHLWDGDILCLPGSIVPASGPVLVPTHLQTELVLRCRQETDCDLCVRVTVHLAVHGDWEEPQDEKTFGEAADAELEEPRNASLQAQVVLYFQAYPTARCVLLEVQVSAALVQPGQSVGSVVFDCFEAALGGEVRIWSYTQPRYQKELNLTQQLPDCRGLEVRNSIQSCWALPWLNVSADGDDVCLVLDISEEQHFSLLLYWNQVQGPLKPWRQRNLTGPQTITLNHTDLVPCLCIQVWPLRPDSIRTNICPFREDPRAHRNLWRAAQLRLLSPRSWRLDAPCSLPVQAVLCWQIPGGGPCQPLVPPLSWENVTVNEAHQFPLLNGHPNLCVQVSSWEKLQLQECLWADSLGPLKDDVLLVETRGPQDSRSLCALGPSGCTSLPSRASTMAARLGEHLLQDLESGQCLQLWDDDLGALWACPTDKYIHKRWALVWLACLLFAAVLFLLLLLKKDHVKGWLRLLKQDVRSGGATRGRATLLLYSADDAGFELLVGALASALCQVPLRVAVDLWRRRELSAQGPLAWFHAQRLQTLQEGGTVVLLFSPGAVALCSEWLPGELLSAPEGPGAGTRMGPGAGDSTGIKADAVFLSTRRTRVSAVERPGWHAAFPAPRPFKAGTGAARRRFWLAGAQGRRGTWPAAIGWTAGSASRTAAPGEAGRFTQAVAATRWGARARGARRLGGWPPPPRGPRGPGSFPTGSWAVPLSACAARSWPRLFISGSGLLPPRPGFRTPPPGPPIRPPLPQCLESDLSLTVLTQPLITFVQTPNNGLTSVPLLRIEATLSPTVTGITYFSSRITDYASFPTHFRWPAIPQFGLLYLQ